MSEYPRISDYDDEYLEGAAPASELSGQAAATDQSDLIKNYLLAQNAKMQQRQEIAEQSAADNRYSAQMGGAFNTIGQALAGQKVDNSAFDKMAQDANEPIARLDRIDKNRLGRDKLVTDYIVSKYKVGENSKLRAEAAEEKSRHNRMMERLAGDKTNAKGTVGQQSLDRTFGKEYDDWTSGGQSSVDKNLNKLNSVLNTLTTAGKNSNLSGRYVGRVPDILRSEESINVRDDIRSAVMETLRATLGSQFTEKEGERIFNLAYDQKLSPESNIPRLKSQIQYLQDLKRNKEAKARFFEENEGSLRGYRAGGSAPATTPPPNNKKTAGKTPTEEPMVKMRRKSNGKPGSVRQSQVQEAIDSGEFELIEG